MSEKNTNRNCRFVTAEAVRAGHPDKFCDQLADRLLDEHLRGDPDTRAAIEVMAAGGKILVAGEVASKASVDVERVLKQLCAEVGYTMGRAVHRWQSVARSALEQSVAGYRAGRRRGRQAGRGRSGSHGGLCHR